MKNNFIEHKYEQGLPIYGYNIIIIVSTDINQSRIKRNKEIGREWEEDYTTRALHSAIDGRPVSYIFVPHDSTVSEMSHESMHCMQRIVEWIGATYRDPEFIAYLLGYIVDAVYCFVTHFNKNYYKKH